MLIRVISLLIILIFLSGCVPCLCVKEIIVIRQETVYDTVVVYHHEKIIFNPDNTDQFKILPIIGDTLIQNEGIKIVW